ncbi:hypothetical protein [Geitlerinema sp. PCC 7407]|uniref:hypothetical protein n=1 Tax=Geitlerinema sp. PCC 7407 TaxID=1173025 RepID=UPI00029FDEA2|nr:hypothetical protein [Geitlerinema sp. PCC 7407]AFY66202.1 hypothetical protein GEI7407_1713 [Geitlerinema sp. PCC 7407]
MPNSPDPSKHQNSFFKELVLINAQANPPEEWRASLKLLVSALLALILWGFLGYVAVFHLLTSRQFAQKVADLPAADPARVAQMEKAMIGFNSTVQTLYALLTPLATAVTGYFFAVSGSSRGSFELAKPALPERSSEPKPPEA